MPENLDQTLWEQLAALSWPERICSVLAAGAVAGTLWAVTVLVVGIFGGAR
jgi:hypothetical protein